MEQAAFFKRYITEESYHLLEIPTQVLNQLKMNNGSQSYLIGPNVEEWRVRFARNTKEGFFIDGWRDFVIDNCVTSNDLLLFQHEGNLRFKVNLFRPSGCESEDAWRAKSSQKKIRSFVQSRNFPEGDRQPMFFKEFVPDLSSSKMVIPIGFVEDFMKGDMRNYADLVDCNGKKWRVRFVFERKKGWFFHKGWKQFWKAHGIGSFNFIFFRYVGNMQFEVKIFENNECVKLSNLEMKPKHNITKKPKHNITKGARDGFVRGRRGRQHVPSPAEQRVADSFTSNRPWFVRTLRWRQGNSPSMYMPCIFFKEHNIDCHNQQEIVLRSQNNTDHYWIVKLREYPYAYSLSFGTGFPKFLHENNVSDGDIIIFEVVRSFPLEMLVHLAPRSHDA